MAGSERRLPEPAIGGYGYRVESMTTALIAAATALVVYGLTTYNERRRRWEDRRGDTYVEMLTLVQQVMHDVNEWREWVGDFGPVLTPTAELSERERAVIRAKVTAWGSATSRDLLARLDEQFLFAQRHYWRHQDVVERSKIEGFEADPAYNLGNVAEAVDQVDALAERLTETVRSELQPGITIWRRVVNWRPRRRRAVGGSNGEPPGPEPSPGA